MLEPEEFVRAARRKGEFVLDLETVDIRTGKGGLDPTTGRIRGIGMALSEDESVWYGFGHDGGRSYVKVREQLAPLFADPDVLMVNHNLKFDYKWLLWHGCEINNRLACTQVASWLINEDREFRQSSDGKKASKYGLKKLVHEHFSHRMNTFDDVGTLFGPPMAEYGQEDCLWTYKLWKFYENELKVEGVSNVFERIEMPLLPILADMELTGITLDKKAMLTHKELLDGSQQVLTKEIHELAGHAFMISSSEQVSDVLFNELGIPTDDDDRPVPFGKSERPSTSNKVLEQFEHDFPIIKKLLKYRHNAVLLSSFCDKLLMLSRNSVDGRVRGSFNQTGTKIGRLSSSDPNMQNVPRPDQIKDDPDSKHRSIRGAFIASKGKLLVDADLSQIELRMMAHWSEDPIMQMVYRSGGKCPDSCDAYQKSVKKGEPRCRHTDIHTATSEALTVPRNPIAKNINFGACYRIGPKKLRGYAKIDSFENAAKFLKGWYQTYKGVTQFHADVENYLKSHAWIVETITGRKRRLKKEAGINEYRAVTQGVQFIISGSSQDLIKIAMRNLHQEIKERRKDDPKWREVHFLSQVHDEVLSEAPEEIAQEVLKRKIHYMETADAGKLLVPVAAEGGCGRRWTEAH